nr:hypothetical protein BaRGS_030165 [Batillaria attramentaria]
MLVRLLTLLGADEADAEADAKEFVDFEIQIANISIPKDETKEAKQMYKATTIEELEQKYPEPFSLSAVLLHPSMLSRGCTLMSECNAYPENKVSGKTRVLANYLMSSLRSHAGHLTSDYREIMADFEELLLMVEKLVASLKASFVDMIRQTEWLSTNSKNTAVEKARALKARIGYPDYVTDDSYLETRYAEFFPAGFIQPPIFDDTYPSSMNYGGMGSFIGREMAHGFGEMGRKFDKEGQPRMWWTPEDELNFAEQAECMVDHYSCFRWKPARMNIDGLRTLEENIADNGGLKQSYRGSSPTRGKEFFLLAYRHWVEKRGIEERLLPGLNLTHNQLFFLSFAQLWCTNDRDEYKVHKIQTDTYAPAPFRVIGTLQNFEDFATAFKCPVGSRMNPEKKCKPYPNSNEVLDASDASRRQTTGPDLYPVLVFIHGGGFVSGSADTAEPGVLVTNADVIVVTINYRLGIFGFLSTGDSALPGNYGLWDQNLALKWVKANIAQFGGDPGKITISGESAGAAAVSFQSLSPHSQGLFSKAILQGYSLLDYQGVLDTEGDPGFYVPLTEFARAVAKGRKTDKRNLVYHFDYYPKS